MRQALLLVQREHYQHFDKSQYSLSICLDILVYYNTSTVFSSNLLYNGACQSICEQYWVKSVNSRLVSKTVSNLWFMKSVNSSNLLHTPPPVQKDLLKAQEGDKEVRELAKNITMPLLILWGQHDRVRELGLLSCRAIYIFAL